jgi:MerR family transcriptional regulator, light-induced transcriptional regulator
MNPITATDPAFIPVHRIGAVSSLCGVPVATLRVWERRYGVVAPPKTDGGQRLYSDHDVLKLTLLKTLTQHGHAISTMGAFAVPQLQSMLNDHRAAKSLQNDKASIPGSISLAVVGFPLASRIETERFTQVFGPQTTLKVDHMFADIKQALAASVNGSPDILLVQMGSVQVSIQQDLQRLRQQLGVRRCVLIYHFATVAVLQYLHSAGVIARREPVSDVELSDIIHSVAYVDNSWSLPATSGTGIIPPRKYSDRVLQRMADISTNVLCECPRHVADLVGMLNSFEAYSQDCLSRTTEDARLHSYLTAVSGSARALFEQALERIAAHEKIDLSE